MLTLLVTVCLCRQFVDACGQGLGVNERLIKEDQQEYHDEMKANYRDLTRELSNIMHEQVAALEMKPKGFRSFSPQQPVGVRKSLYT